MRSLCRSLKVLWKLCLLSSSGCYICRMSWQQLYIQLKIQIILYTAKCMRVRFNCDNVSFERGVTPKKWPSVRGGSRRKNEDGGAMVIRNGGSKNSTSPRTLQKMNAPLSIHAVRTGTSFSVWPLSFHNGSSVVRSSGLCETGFSSIHMEYRNPRQTPSSLWHSPHKLWHSTCESFCRS